MTHRRVVWLLTLAVVAWSAALYVLQLHIVTGPAEQSIIIQWAPETPDLARRTAERALFLLGREQASPWSERLQTALFAAGSLWLFLVVERGWGWV